MKKTILCFVVAVLWSGSVLAQWSTDIETVVADTDEVYFDVATNTLGKTMVVWSQYDYGPGEYAVNVKRHDQDNGWSDIENIFPFGSGTDGTPDIAMDAVGNALVALGNENSNEEGGGTYYSVDVIRYDVSTGWSDATTIETSTNQIAEADVVMDESGAAVVYWNEYTEDTIYIKVKHYNVLTGWGDTQVAYTATKRSSATPFVTVNSQGSEVMLLSVFESGSMNIYYSQYDSLLSQWSVPVVIDQTNQNAFSPKIALDPNGNMIVVWYQAVESDVVTYDVYARRYNVNQGWGSGENIETLAGEAYQVHIAVDMAGNALVVWSQQSTALYANRYDAGSQIWSTPEILQTDRGRFNAVGMAGDIYGNAIVVWNEYSGDYNGIFTKRYSTPDVDGDGYFSVNDCDDDNALVHLGATEICGDGLDNDCVSGDETCSVTPAVCGNSLIDSGEICDDGNTAGGDGCSPTCVTEVAITSPVCGNGTLETGEACDDSNTTDGDGCDASCQVEQSGSANASSGGGCSLNEQTAVFSFSGFMMVIALMGVPIIGLRGVKKSSCVFQG